MSDPKVCESCTHPLTVHMESQRIGLRGCLAPGCPCGSWLQAETHAPVWENPDRGFSGDLGARIKVRLAALGVERGELAGWAMARKLGPADLRAWIAGRRVPSTVNALLLAHALGWTLDELAGDLFHTWRLE